MEQQVDDHVLASPKWLFVVRVFQFLVSVVVLGLAGALAHDAYLDEEGLSVAIAVITWIVVLYSLLTEKIGALRAGYNIIAVLVLDAVMVVLWLATFAATAARRAQFKFKTRVSSCFNDGSLVNSEFCYKKREELAKRSNVILFKKGGNMLSATAGLGAIVWLLFIASFAWTLWAFLQARKQGRFQSGNTHSNTQGFQMEPKVEQPQPQPEQQQAVGEQSAGPYVEIPYLQPQGQNPDPYPPQKQQQVYPEGQYLVQQQQRYYQPPYQGSPPPAAVSPPSAATSPPPHQPCQG